MNEIDYSPTCERAGDLVSALYGEAGERERRDFELHLQQCANCRAEFASFAQLREAIGDCRDEALSGFVSAHATPPAKRSARAAWRQFFELSPLWLKGAVGFAAIAFCALAALAVWRSQPTNPAVQVAETNPAAVYTQQDLDRAVHEALAKQQREQRVDEPELAKAESPKPQNRNVAKSEPRARRPFSRAEREQLAADLRLLSSDDEADLDRFDDRINRQR